MVYTQALVFGNGLSVRSEQEKLAEDLSFLQHFRSDRDKLKHCGRLMKAQSSSSLGSECSLEEEGEDDACLQLDLSKRIEKCLYEAKGASLSCRELRLPLRMTTRVAGDILRSSTDEPCGIRGALIHMFMESKGTLLKLGTIIPDQSLTPTFEVSVVLQPDLGGWPPLKILFGGGKVLSLRREYRLIKQKLYSSATPTVLEFY
ncbi:DNA damage-inducible transcript 4-like protein isoform X3 [Sinocyclocheilus rhinocerous]|uniref:DNA damage-inducible transcript 4-like protein n=1 Tax=Sinocyclocheilus rhinocerous TaxID=307959 RepID=A0A673MQ77_9TELE|nr:PREDICTED: DNA damage-inducible transcript 4-like protein isoform X1 [Sinocyclocheilus rhinocerous]XP_016398362.1 PREDICTED: DNA damage-inducible transcript 4-like protein isoform X2 [Sinocyclocheilus rhinocerous]XP_016398363.1 PREDICTED: DNA damage-inducible transcript 4-like protein isoform X3 [Sinocyclocheilus rhinocerous]